MKMFNKAEVDGNGNIIIQNSDNSVITINKDNPEEIRKFLIDFQNKLSDLPLQILDILEAKNSNDVPVTGANIYLGLQFLINGSNINGISFGVTITNLTKENRFFNSPFFKLSVPFEGNLDTFSLIDKIGNPVVFPKKLEYGEVVSECFQIHIGSKEMYEKALANDPNATIQAITTTTLGEIYKSNEYSIEKLLESFQYAR